MSLFNVFNISGSAMSAQSQRLNAVASNLANADSATSANGTPYKAKQVVFSATPSASPDASGVKTMNAAKTMLLKTLTIGQQ
ncbi:MAG: flagellar basal body protein [Methylotenera sp.]|nr:flagellar basal body protein [Methylotenera sp.]